MQASSKQLERVAEIVSRYRNFSGAAIPILQEIQNELGYVSHEFIAKVSELTKIPASDLYGIVTFYSQFRLEPLGEYHIQICHGTACHLAGADQITEALEIAVNTKMRQHQQGWQVYLRKGSLHRLLQLSSGNQC